MAIHFFNEDIEFPDISKSILKNWLKAVASSYSKSVGELNYIFVSDAKILEVNNEFLQHDYYTDVITFDYTEGDKISGDIYISIETVRTNADKFEEKYQTELHRVIVHGTLHLIGFKDKTEKEAEEMREQENISLEILNQQ